MSPRADGSLAWSIVVLNRGWGARTLLPEARLLAEAGDRAIMLVYVVGRRRRPRRAWLWHGRRAIRRAVGTRPPALATSLTLAESVIAGLGLAAAATGGSVMIRLGDSRHDAELRAKGIPRLALDHRPERPIRPAGPPPRPRAGLWLWRGRS